jgi:hypothetical protein
VNVEKRRGSSREDAPNCGELPSLDKLIDFKKYEEYFLHAGKVKKKIVHSVKYLNAVFIHAYTYRCKNVLQNSGIYFLPVSKYGSVKITYLFPDYLTIVDWLLTELSKCLAAVHEGSTSPIQKPTTTEILSEFHLPTISVKNIPSVSRLSNWRSFTIVTKTSWHVLTNFFVV